MSITIVLRWTASDRAEAWIGDQPLASFEPAALLVDQPLYAQRPVPADPGSYGQRLFAALAATRSGPGLRVFPLHHRWQA